MQINVVNTRSVSKKRKHDNNENLIDQSSPSNVTTLTPSSSNSPSIQPLQCNPQNLWHLRFAHASSTMLRKHLYIKSNHDSTHCTIYIRAKQTRKPFHRSESKVTRKLERLHSDLCGPFPISKGKSVYILTFLDELTHWCWVITIPDKSSATVCREYRNGDRSQDQIFTNE